MKGKKQYGKEIYKCKPTKKNHVIFSICKNSLFGKCETGVSSCISDVDETPFQLSRATMPRTSARLKEKIENRPPAHHPCNTTTQTVAKASTSRPQKKQKRKAAVHGTVSDSTQPKIKGKKGKLRNMTKMPIDILFEVFGQLEPVDLLHLSRATKELRAILITSNATFLWKRV